MSTKKNNSIKTYVSKRLDEVTKILDDIAEHTGREYVVLNGKFIGLIVEAGNNLAEGITETVKVVNNRRKLANKFWESENDD